MENVKFALFLAAALAAGLALHEFAHALAADRLGDPTPRRWGRLTLSAKGMVDPFGSLILPALILILWAAGRPVLPPFAYAKPLPLDATYLKHRDRDVTLIGLAGPLANLILAAIAGGLLRVGFGGDVFLIVVAFLYVNLFLFVFNLMPVPGLDGAKILARFLPPRPREVFTGLDQYLVLFILAIFFLLSRPMLSIVGGVSSGVCRLVAGDAICRALPF